jgi:predicted nucleic acid-binding protein
MAAIDRLRSEDGRVPAIWWFEVRNALLMNERRGRISERGMGMLLHHLARLPIAVDLNPDGEVLLSQARRHNLTVYDAAYLELATRTGSPLATLDRALAKAARTESILLIGTP